MTDIKNCNFYGVKWDGDSLKAVNTVALALLNLTELFVHQNIQIECLIKIEPEKIAQESQEERCSEDSEQVTDETEKTNNLECELKF